MGIADRKILGGALQPVIIAGAIDKDGNAVELSDAGLTSSGKQFVTPVLTVHATYVANDYVGTSGVPMEFTEAARENGGTGYVQSAILIDKALQSISGELWLFDETVTPPNDSAAWTITDDEMLHCIGVLPFSTYYASAANSVALYTGNPIGFKCLANSKSLYGCFVTRGAPAYASGDLSFKLITIQD